jgi:hypothetical protein
VRADLHEVIADEPVVVEEVRRNPEGALAGHRSNYPF